MFQIDNNYRSFVYILKDVSSNKQFTYTFILKMIHSTKYQDYCSKSRIFQFRTCQRDLDPRICVHRAAEPSSINPREDIRVGREFSKRLTILACVASVPFPKSRSTVRKKRNDTSREDRRKIGTSASPKQYLSAPWRILVCEIRGGILPRVEEHRWEKGNKTRKGCSEWKSRGLLAAAAGTPDSGKRVLPAC